MKKIISLILVAATLLFAALATSSCNKTTEGTNISYDVVINASGTTLEIASITAIQVAMKAAIIASLGPGTGGVGVYSYSSSLDSKAITACDNVYNGSQDKVYPSSGTWTLTLVRNEVSENPKSATLKVYSFKAK